MTPAKACDYNYEGVYLAGFFAQKCKIILISNKSSIYLEN